MAPDGGAVTERSEAKGAQRTLTGSPPAPPSSKSRGRSASCKRRKVVSVVPAYRVASRPSSASVIDMSTTTIPSGRGTFTRRGELKAGYAQLRITAFVLARVSGADGVRLAVFVRKQNRRGPGIASLVTPIREGGRGARRAATRRFVGRSHRTVWQGHRRPGDRPFTPTLAPLGASRRSHSSQPRAP